MSSDVVVLRVDSYYNGVIASIQNVYMIITVSIPERFQEILSKRACNGSVNIPFDHAPLFSGVSDMATEKNWAFEKCGYA